VPAAIEGTSDRLPIHSSLAVTLREHSTLITSEDILVIDCEPEAVFRVRDVTRCSSTLPGHTAPILCAAFSPTGTYLVTGSGDNTARVWNLDSETPKHTLAGHNGWILCVEWDGLERYVATGSLDKNVRLWDPHTGKPIGEPLRGHGMWITSLAWEPIHLCVSRVRWRSCELTMHSNARHPRLASSSKDSTVRVWNPLSKRVDFTLGGHTQSVNIVRWGGDGILYTGSSDRTVKMWSAKDVRHRDRSLQGLIEILHRAS
jgi:ribosome assembly protein 4